MNTLFEILVNERITMRLMKESEAKIMFNLIESNRVFLRRFLTWVDKSIKVEDSFKKIQKDHEGFKSGESLELGIFFEERFIGRCGFHNIQKHSAEIGYFLAEDMNGRGIMTKCVKKITEYGLNELDKHRIIIKVDVENTASESIPQKLGFTLEGTERESHMSPTGEWRDTHVYSFVQGDKFLVD